MSQALDCFHCGEPVIDAVPVLARVGNQQRPVCCVGCQAVAEFIDASKLGAFYRFRSRPDPALELKPEPADWKRYDSADLQSRYVHQLGDSAESTLEIGGIYCSACVWLLENALKELHGVFTLEINPATRRAVIRWSPSLMPFSELLASIARIGFRPRPLDLGHAEDTQDREYRTALKRLIVAAAAGMQVMMFAVALYAGEYFGIEGNIEKFLRLISLLVTIPVIFYSARPFYAAAWRGVRARAPGMDLPVALAISAAFLASVRAIWIDQGDIYFDSVAMFVLFLSATRFLEMKARHRSDDFALALARLLPDTATRVTDGRQETVALDRLRVNDVILIRSGDVVPVDGEMRSGNLSIDESILSGESMPVSRSAGMAVLAGSINRGGSAEVVVTQTGASTNLAEISRLLERARADRPPIAQLADRIAGYFVVGVLVIATIAGLSWLAWQPARAFEVVLATLVVTCPCALALATPAALAAAASTLAGRGFLLVRSRLLEVLAGKPVIVFDKTGTLTAGKPEIAQTTLLSGNYSMSECLAIAAALETASEHILARAFAAHFRPQEVAIDAVRIEAGRGVEGRIDGIRWRIGSEEFVSELSGMTASDTPLAQDGTLVLLGNERQAVARFDIGDELRADAPDAIASLVSAGFRVMIASGDRVAPVRRVAEKLGVKEWHASLRPEAKVALVEAMRERGELVVMIGDGINDTPVLAAADASIALDAGTALARASADAVVLGKRLFSIVDAASMALAARRIVRQNISWAIVYNLTAVPLAVGGILAPWMAALGMSFSSLFVVLNALRLRRHFP
ncbi:MAG: heavy metal translocating P-type ATPase, partial [Gammaproteobacteria bacterium]|nr:heavy metal translocating P-type ATPase [Gammaproteobacteria bacterium]